jgi:hypothetical protein
MQLQAQAQVLQRVALGATMVCQWCCRPFWRLLVSVLALEQSLTASLRFRCFDKRPLGVHSSLKQ